MNPKDAQAAAELRAFYSSLFNAPDFLSRLQSPVAYLLI